MEVSSLIDRSHEIYIPVGVMDLEYRTWNTYRRKLLFHEESDERYGIPKDANRDSQFGRRNKPKPWLAHPCSDQTKRSVRSDHDIDGIMEPETKTKISTMKDPFGFRVLQLGYQGPRPVPVNTFTESRCIRFSTGAASDRSCTAAVSS